ncbi:MAG: hypothetical protein H6707_05480 [Deltaproteobacteria bacterium]|nr:hypothetical protein [Deltaproteobacteria bacterium]
MRCDCLADERPVTSCESRSPCALAYFVADQPARCCVACSGGGVATRGEGQCLANEVYLHECVPGSRCAEEHRALILGTLHVPFELEAAGLAGAILAAVWQDSASGQTWVVGSHGQLLGYRDGNWSAYDLQTKANLIAVWGRVGGDGWIVGEDGAVFQYDGTRWRARADLPRRVAWRGVAGDADRVVIIGADGAVLALTDRWTDLQAPEAHQWVDLVVDRSTVWLLDQQGALHAFAQGGWRDVELPSGLPLRAIWQDAQQRLLVADADNRLYRREQERWTQFASPPPLRAGIADYASAADDGVWAVGRSGQIARFIHGGWRLVSYFSASPIEQLYAVFAAKQMVWAVGQPGVILRAVSL